MEAKATGSRTSQLVREIEARVEELARGTDALRASETFYNYLKVMGRFHKYSIGNVLLIFSQMPGATLVAGYHTWQKLGRQVRKGEKGIAILAPMTWSKQEQAEDGSTTEVPVRWWKTVAVFDVSQTDGEPLPELGGIPHETDEALAALLTQVAEDRGFHVVIDPDLRDGVQGYSDGREIHILPDTGTQVLAHELAHTLLRHPFAVRDGELSREEAEVEAEGAAYAVAAHFGLDPSSSVPYLVGYWTDAKAVRAHLEAIRSAAAEIIDAVEAKRKPVRQEFEVSVPALEPALAG